MAAIAACLLFSALASASEDDLFSQPAQKAAEPVRVYQSKPPALLPPEQPTAQDLFAARPSPSVEALKAHAEQRLLPGADRPLVIGMCCKGVVANYDEAYRLSLKTGKPLRVLVGQTMDRLIAQGATEDGFIKCRVDPEAHPAFRQPGIYEYQPIQGKLYGRSGLPGTPIQGVPQQQPAPGQTINVSAPVNSVCNTPDCACGCSAGALCVCSQPTPQPQPQPQPLMQPTVQYIQFPQVQWFGGGGCPGGNCGGGGCANGRCGR